MPANGIWDLIRRLKVNNTWKVNINLRDNDVRNRELGRSKLKLEDIIKVVI
jgi:hypothetical protein